MKLLTVRRKAAVRWRTAFLGLCSLALTSLPLARLKAENALTVGEGAANAGAVADIPLQVSGDSDIQGLVLVVESADASAAKMAGLVPADGAGEALASADLVTNRVEDGFAILAVVMDADGQDAEKIPAGQNTRVGTLRVRCDGPSQGQKETALRLVDNKYARVDGAPLLSNLISIGGQSITAKEGLRLRNGRVICTGEGGGPGGNVMFACGGSLDDEGLPKTVNGSRLSTKKVTFYYKAPDSKQKIQGLSMSVNYHCDLAAQERTFSLEGGALEAAGAEFVHLEVDNLYSGSDGDTCQFSLGVLVDATAPFDGRTLPITSSLRKLFSIDFLIEDDADCGRCYWIKFMDGATGDKDIPPTKNLVSINFQSVSPETMNCSICVQNDVPAFARGDCNMSFGGSMAVDIADAAAAVGYIFLTGSNKFDAPCEDACDANDDGRLDAADVVFILSYLFIPKSPRPPAPGPTKVGPDPTADKLTCEGGRLTDC